MFIADQGTKEQVAGILPWLLPHSCTACLTAMDSGFGFLHRCQMKSQGPPELRYVFEASLVNGYELMIVFPVETSARSGGLSLART